MFNILCRFSHSNGTVILQTVMTYGRILYKHRTNVHQRNPTYQQHKVLLMIPLKMVVNMDRNM